MRSETYLRSRALPFLHTKRRTDDMLSSHHTVGIGRTKTLSAVFHAEAVHIPRRVLLRSTVLNVRVGWTDFIKAIRHDA